MNETHGPQDKMSPEELAWAQANLPKLHRWVSGRRFLRDALLIAFAFGLASHVAGYLLQTVASGEPLRLLADLLATLGTTVWTGVVLFSFIEVLPAAKRRSATRWLTVYEAEIRGQAAPRDQ